MCPLNETSAKHIMARLIPDKVIHRSEDFAVNVKTEFVSGLQNYTVA